MKVNIQTKKIVVTGPESSGKTTLAKQLAEKLSAPWVPEYARDYLEKLNRPYQANDILNIGAAQMAQHSASYQQNPSYLICDTSFLVLKIWNEVKFLNKQEWLEVQFLQDPVDLYLLCAPDIPWTYDPLRENPDDRQVLFDLYQQALQNSQKNYLIIKGTDPQLRLEEAAQAVKKLS
ncbi:MAG: hypothetical protein Sapg2KO_43500 [Saprospiraceae bacterium]